MARRGTMHRSGIGKREQIRTRDATRRTRTSAGQARWRGPASAGASAWVGCERARPGRTLTGRTKAIAISGGARAYVVASRCVGVGLGAWEGDYVGGMTRGDFARLFHVCVPPIGPREQARPSPSGPPKASREKSAPHPLSPLPPSHSPPLVDARAFPSPFSPAQARAAFTEGHRRRGCSARRAAASIVCTYSPASGTPPTGSTHLLPTHRDPESQPGTHRPRVHTSDPHPLPHSRSRAHMHMPIPGR
ncbi:hypothetical protein C2E23DRAFT_354475 [Lenzites betulinus]|nr:hypothetical protein C2E23DRAFT_354475 [Lenzites betulinus]